MSMASLSRRLLLSRSLCHSNPNALLSTRFCATTASDSDSDSDVSLDSDLESDPAPSKPSTPNTIRRPFENQPLENGVDVGIYKAILVGLVGQTPFEKRMKSGAALTMFSIGTGGIRNNRRPFQTENPTEYANRCVVQWHRVCVYPENLGKLVLKNALPGSIIYVEGNLETKVFSHPTTGIIHRFREIAVRRNGRIVFLGKGDDSEPAPSSSFRGVGYY